MAKISVIIPVYNGEKTLADAISSVMDQTQKPHEVIVVNDGSTDDSSNIAKSFDVKVIDQVNKGLAAARNTGVMNAKGDYILPLDADDIFLENCVERVTQEILDTEADVIGISFKTFGKVNSNVILIENPTLEDFKQGNRLAYCSAIKRSVLLECGGWSPRMDNMFRDDQGRPKGGYEDLHLWYDLLKREKEFVTIQEPLFLYRTQDQSMIHESQKQHALLMSQIQKDFDL